VPNPPPICTRVICNPRTRYITSVSAVIPHPAGARVMYKGLLQEGAAQLLFWLGISLHRALRLEHHRAVLDNKGTVYRNMENAAAYRKKVSHCISLLQYSFIALHLQVLTEDGAFTNHRLHHLRCIPSGHPRTSFSLPAPSKRRLGPSVCGCCTKNALMRPSPGRFVRTCKHKVELRPKRSSTRVKHRPCASLAARPEPALSPRSLLRAPCTMSKPLRGLQQQAASIQ
jgi:hypothetical protein